MSYMTFGPSHADQRGALDVLGLLLAPHLAAAPAYSARRAWLIPAVVVLMGLVVLQEGYARVAELVHNAETALPLLADLGLRVSPLPLMVAALLLIAWTVGTAPVVYRRSMRRLNALGLDA